MGTGKFNTAMDLNPIQRGRKNIPSPNAAEREQLFIKIGGFLIFRCTYNNFVTDKKQVEAYTKPLDVAKNKA